MGYRYTIFLLATLALVGCVSANRVDGTDESAFLGSNHVGDEGWEIALWLKPGAECPSVAVTSDPSKPVLCIVSVPSAKEGSKHRVVRLGSDADCPGRRFDGIDGELCLVEFPRNWDPYVYNGHLYYFVDL